MVFQENFSFVEHPTAEQLQQYYILRAKVYNEILPNKPFPEGAVPSDQLPNAKLCLITNGKNNVIAGVRLNIIVPGENRKITFGDRTGFDVYDDLKKSDIDLDNLKHSEIGSFIIDEKYRGGNLAGGQVVKRLLAGVFEAAKNENVDIVFVCPPDSQNTLLQRHLDQNRMDYLPFGSFNIKQGNEGFYSEDKKSLFAISLSDKLDLAALRSRDNLRE